MCCCALIGVAVPQQFIDRFRFNAKRAPLVQSRLKALAKLQPVHAVVEDPDFQFSFPKCDELVGSLVEFRDVNFQASAQTLRMLRI